MRLSRAYCAAILAVALVTPFALTQDKAATPKETRETPIVKAVKKTIEGVVAIRVPRPGERDMVGSGIIFHQKDDLGLIVTNRHVTGGKKQVKVRLNDGTDLIGNVVVSEPDLDLAIVQIKTSKKLKTLRFAPNDCCVGEDVIAIGSPYGYDATVSKGIISAINREITMPNDVTMTGIIQHDAPINPGNSGGPLVNVITAEVVGINVAMRDNAANIAFTINSGTVEGYLTKYLRSAHGIAHGLTLENQVVAEVGDRQRVVIKNSSHAELKSGDELRALGECRVVSSLDIERALWQSKPGQQVEIKVNRDGREVIVRLTLTGAGSVAAVSQEAPADSVRAAGER
jgi:serine protease Do